MEPASLLLPEGTRLVHIGPPKTGTTTLQSAFHECRAEASAQGVYYAGAGRQPVSAVQAIVGSPAPETGAVPSIADWTSLVDEIRSAGDQRVVLSSERLSNASPDAIRTIVDDIGRDQVHIVVTLRPLARIIPSQWQQKVQTGVSVSFDDYLEQIFDTPDGPQHRAFWRMHRHDRLIGQWAAQVGPGNVTVIALDEMDHAMVLRVFEQLLGLRDGTLAADPGRTNRSMTMAEIELVRAFNRQYFGAGLTRESHTRLMRRTGLYIETRTPAPGESRIEMPQWALDRARDVADEMVDAIVASGVRLVGDPERLRPTITSRLDDERQLPAGLTPEVAARAAIGVLLASGVAPIGGNGRFVPRPSVEPIELARLSTRRLIGLLAGRIRTGTRVRIARLVGRSG